MDQVQKDLLAFALCGGLFLFFQILFCLSMGLAGLPTRPKTAFLDMCSADRGLGLWL